MRVQFLVALALLCRGVVPSTAQPQAAAASDIPFEMPGVFRISLPQGWSQSKVIDDRHAVAVFSNKELTLEVLHDKAAIPAEQYAQEVTERRMRPEADEYAGKYAPPEVRAKPGDFVAEITHRFDEYTLISGLPAQWARYHWHYSHPQKEGEQATPDDSSIHDAVVWSVFTLSPGEYWSLELRGDEKANWPDDLRRMVRSFQLLDPMLSRAKAAAPKEAWNRMPPDSANGMCQFAGVGSGIGALLPCDWNVTYQDQNAPPADPSTLTLVGLDQLQGSRVTASFRHVFSNWSADKIVQIAEQQVSGEINSLTAQGWNGKYGRRHCHWGYGSENEDDDAYDEYGRWCYRDPKIVNEKLSYHRDEMREVAVDGFQGTFVSATATAKKARKTIDYRLLEVSQGTDHFLAMIVFNPSECDNCHIDQILSSVRLYALRPKVEAIPDDTDAVCKGLIDRMASELSQSMGLDKIFEVASGSDKAKTAQAPPPKQPDTDTDKRCVERLESAAERELEDARFLNNSESHLKLGRELKSEGKEDAALAEYKTAIRLNPRNEDANRAIASLFAARGEINDAIAANERILYYEADADKDEETHAQLAYLYAHAGANVLAANHLTMAGTQAPQNILSDDDLADANKQLEDLGHQLEKANKDYDANPTPENSLLDAELGLRVGDFPGADSICRGVLEQDGKNLRALTCLAATSYARGECELVIQYAQGWLTAAPDDPSAYLWIARGKGCEPADHKSAAENYEAAIRHADQRLQPSALLEAQIGGPGPMKRALCGPRRHKHMRQSLTFIQPMPMYSTTLHGSSPPQHPIRKTPSRRSVTLSGPWRQRRMTPIFLTLWQKPVSLTAE